MADLKIEVTALPSPLGETAPETPPAPCAEPGTKRFFQSGGAAANALRAKRADSFPLSSLSRISMSLTAATPEESVVTSGDFLPLPPCHRSPPLSLTSLPPLSTPLPPIPATALHPSPSQPCHRSPPLPFAPPRLQILKNAALLRTNQGAALGILSWLGFATGFLGNMLLLSYFTAKRELSACLVQVVGAASTAVLLSQVYLAGFMPSPAFTAVAAYLLLGCAVNCLRFTRRLPQPLWDTWQDVIGVLGLAVLPQVIWSTFSSVSTKLPGTVSAVGGLLFIAAMRRGLVGQRWRDRWQLLSGWTATLLFMVMPVAQLQHLSSAVSSILLFHLIPSLHLPSLHLIPSLHLPSLHLIPSLHLPSLHLIPSLHLPSLHLIPSLHLPSCISFHLCIFPPASHSISASSLPASHSISASSLPASHSISASSLLHLIPSLHLPSLHLIPSLHLPSLHLIPSLHLPSLHLIPSLHLPSLHLIPSLHLPSLHLIPSLHLPSLQSHSISASSLPASHSISASSLPASHSISASSLPASPLALSSSLALYLTALSLPDPSTSRTLLSPPPSPQVCFTRPDQLAGMSALSSLLGIVGNGLMVPRALFTRDFICPPLFHVLRTQAFLILLAFVLIPSRVWHVPFRYMWAAILTVYCHRLDVLPSSMPTSAFPRSFKCFWVVPGAAFSWAWGVLLAMALHGFYSPRLFMAVSLALIGYLAAVFKFDADAHLDNDSLGVPEVVVEEYPDAIKIVATVPGLEKKDLQVQVRGKDVVTISGKRTREERDNDDSNRVVKEFSSFERSFRLPRDVSTKQVTAAARNGVLTVTVPKERLANKRLVAGSRIQTRRGKRRMFRSKAG
ncbi:unnamed protein product [Closterium sp. NIES-64]|nr:unnamed protein product [Closterium sp. NIES-64]